VRAIAWTAFGATSGDGELWKATMSGHGDGSLLLLGGMHGDEPQGTHVLLRLLADPSLSTRELAWRTVVVVPALNPDGLRAGTRVNGRGVDLNRNLPTENWQPRSAKPEHHPGPAPASEPETQSLIRLVEEMHPALIVTLHAPYACINYDGPAEEEAKRLAAALGYPVWEEIGYPTPGSFGTWAGVERGIPTLTVEFDDIPPAAWERSRNALVSLVTRV
jgi:murein peptide amidase A